MNGSGDRDYWGDVVYEVWRRGGNSDLVDRDRTEDCRYDGLYPEEAASREMRRQRRQRQEYPQEEVLE